MMLLKFAILSIAATAFAQSPATSPVFEVASIKPSAVGARTRIAVQPGGRFSTTASLALLIAAAYRMLDYQIIGAKGWVRDDRWDIEAKADAPDPPQSAPPFLSVPDATAARLRTLLETRFQLKTHRETREMQVYTLTILKGGTKLQPADSATAAVGTRAGPGIIDARAISMDQLLILLGRLMDHPVIDKTGLSGYFNFQLQFDPTSAPRAALSSTTSPAATDPAGLSLFAAIEKQLGLKLEAAREPVGVLIIDSVERPTEN